MNWTASPLADRKELHRAIEKERCFKGRKGSEKEIIRKECAGKVALLRGTEGAYSLDYLTTASQVISCSLVKSYIPGHWKL